MVSSLRSTHVNFLAVWPSMFAVSLGLMAIIPTLGLYIEERFGIAGEDLERWTGWIYAGAPLSAAIVGPAWGVLGDRIGRKSMVVRATVAIGIATALMPFASSPGWLLALRIVQGAFAGFVAPAMVLGTTGVPRFQQGHVIGRLQLAMALGLLVGPVIGGEVAFRFGRESVFYMTSAVSLVAAVPILFLVKEDRSELLDGEGAPGKSFAGRMFADLLGLLGNTTFLVLLFCVFLLRFGQHMVEPYIALFVRQLGPLPMVSSFVDDPELALERTIAIAFVVLAVAQILFTTRWGRLSDRIGPVRCMSILGLGLAVVFFLTAAARSASTFLALRTAAAVFMAGGMTLAYAAVARRVRPERKNLAFTLVQSGMQFGLALGPVLGEVLAADAGMSGLYVTGGVCLALAGIGLAILRALSSPRPPAGTDLR